MTGKGRRQEKVHKHTSALYMRMSKIADSLLTHTIAEMVAGRL